MRILRVLICLLAFAMPVAFAQQSVINIGTSANDNTGDPARTWAAKDNGMFHQLYGVYGPSSSLATTGVPVWADLMSLCTGTKTSGFVCDATGAMVSVGGGGGVSLSIANTWTNTQTFTDSDLLLLGTSTGKTTFTSDNASATNYAWHIQAANDTFVGRATPDTLINKSIDHSEIVGLGDLALANAATPPAWGGTTPAAGKFSSLTDSGVTGLIQCAHFSSTGLLTGTGSDCGSGGGSPAFGSVTTGTSAVALHVGTGGSLDATGGGSILATGLASLTGMPSQAACTIVANATVSAAVPIAVTCPALQAAMVAANALTVTDATPGSTAINDYAPSGFGTTTAFLNVTAASGGTTINGMVAGSNAQEIVLTNMAAIGSGNNISMPNESSSDTTAANRIFASGTLSIPPRGAVLCFYQTGSVNRWMCH